jgi:protein SCO1/2
MKTMHSFIAAAIIAASSHAVSFSTERIEPLPPELEGVGVTEHPNALLPKDLVFTDETGRQVRLGEYFTGQKPVILTLNYSNCPMLCQVMLDGLVEGLTGSKWTLGKDFDVVTVSIDPRELPQRANLTKQKYMKEYGRPETAPGWHFLVGSESNIRSLADTVGFGYKYDEEQDQYIHAAVAMVCTPEGHLSRYLYGVMYEPQTLTFALLEASQGKVGTTLDQVLLFCFHYDDKSGRYGLAAMNLMRTGAIATVIVLGLLLGIRWHRDAQRRRRMLGVAK